MIVNYLDQAVQKGKKSIFLAGPTPRTIEVESWRKNAIRTLKELEFDGIVYVPELENNDRTTNYDDLVWWTREALHEATMVVFWIPRNISTLPAFNTNVEFGYWMAKNSEKVIYGRPDDSVKNTYLDWLYYAETLKKPFNNLTSLLKEAVEIVTKMKVAEDIDSYELNIIKMILKKYPEIKGLVGEVQFTPESYGVSKEKTYGKMFFKDASDDNLKEFDRTILSVLLYYYIKDNRYDKFVTQQSGDNKLSKETFDEIRDFVIKNFNSPRKENLLLYYVVVNDLGKSVKMVEKLKEYGVETVDHDLVLNYLIQYRMLPSINKFTDSDKQSLINVLNNGINFGQFIQGECVDYSFDKLQNLSSFEKILMSTEAMLDIGGVLGHVNNTNGSAILNQSTADNFLTASKILSVSTDYSKIFNEFLNEKSKK